MRVQPSDALPKIMLARYYGANLGRSATADLVSPLKLQHRFPDEFDALLGRPIVWNKYVYALDNPLAYVDPTGRTAEGVLTWKMLGRLGAGAAVEPGPFGEAALLGLAGGYASYRLGQMIAEARSNQDLFDQAMKQLKAAWADMDDPNHNGMDPNEPRWKGVAQRFWNKIRKAINNAERIRNKKLYGELVREINRATNEWTRRFGALSPHGTCRDNRCGADKEPQPPGPFGPR